MQSHPSLCRPAGWPARVWSEVPGTEGHVEVGVGDSLALRGEQLDQVWSAVLLRGAEHLDEGWPELIRADLIRAGGIRGHRVHSFASPDCGVAAPGVGTGARVPASWVVRRGCRTVCWSCVTVRIRTS